MAVFAIGALAVGLVLACVVLTIAGQRRRGGGWALSVAAGCFFPVTWVAWYVADELPLPRTR